MRLIISLLINGAIIFFSAQYLDGITVEDYPTAIIAAAVLGLANFFIKPILNILAFPITVITLGLFSLVISGAMILLVDFFVDGLIVSSFLHAIILAVVLAIANGILSAFDKKD
jgi:putative membrane protein